ncbi:MAG: hypothetical protein A2Z91_00665 [Deltaproteobacteria bacterium GWA2_38_16]|nr:MAG: hypothetical protein A2Z91_00665 [Deltaproteobacteria bacterium GWA2_38_16]OGQ03612.1 MAG: hypothetical protein A3D19_02070 [Deltaproteobacteria bacterium RIFCSPHIGHO2_02_FULL_38_15]OGQ35026.1 MAG: hypothetical protein A3A72_07925 [Deltaproteobacteria bacterium RIFCSPLOWO2_01_FULL_38_9]OGQ59882.1 MAG: hypothetical protein A3G92_05660 [Deltaproteobacteria bacterium RIFCSPLOWO2_12_FULL_38_8]HBQ21143.1 GHMP kinase [Deltaproteobacteria bacterium]
MKKPLYTVSAPGRICLFGEHSDYLGLPVITMAMNLRLTISAFPRKDKKFKIIMPDIHEEEIFTPSQALPYTKERDYLRSGVNVLKRKGCSFSKGYDFFVKSKIPINSGASSSSALVVAWVKMLLALQHHENEFNPIEIAKLAYEAEVLEFKEAGGRMDHFAISIGELIYHENHKTIDIRFLDEAIQGIVLGDSLEKKETIETLKKNSREVKEGFRQIKKVISNFNVEITPVQEVLKKISETSDPLQKAMATLKNRDITHQALQELVLKPFQNPKKIGKLMNEHHLMLKKYLKISTPKIERMIKASLKAGAYGAKIHGSGLGGTMIAYAPGREKQVAKAIERVGGKATLVHQDRGVIT